MVEFSAFRDIPFPTQYGPNPTAVSVDLIEAGLVTAFLIVLFSLLLVLPGVKGLKQGISVSARAGFALFVAAVILVCNYSYEWQVGHVEADLQYKQFTHQHVPAELGLRIGLRGINITLKGHPNRKVLLNNVTETIDYNEHFNFGWDQQLNGFGPNAAQLNQELRAAQRRGSPLPILAVAEYFALDGESIRWGRLYRQAGYYTHILMWLALPLWILCCLLATYLSLLYGAVCLMLTGACLLWACVVFVGVHTGETPLVIPIDGNQKLRLSYGWGFGLSLATGLLCMAVGLVLTVLVCYRPLWAADFFGTSLLQVDDEQEEGEDDEDEDVHDYEKIRPRLLTFMGGGQPRPQRAENGEVTSPGAWSRTSFRSSFRRRRVSRQPSTASTSSSASAHGRVVPRQWRRPRPTSRLSMSVVQQAMAVELKPIHTSNAISETQKSSTMSGGIGNNTPSASADRNSAQPTIILYNAVEVPRRPSSAAGLAGHRRAPPPRPPPRLVTRMNTGTSTLSPESDGQGVTYMSQSTRECTL